MKNKIFLFIIFLIFSILTFLPMKTLSSSKIELYFFWGRGCPHCLQEKSFLEKLKQKYPQLEIKEFEVYYNQENKEFFKKIAQAYKTKPSGLPTTFIGKNYIIGFGTEETTGKEIENLVQNCLQNYCPSPEEVLVAGGIDKWSPSEKKPDEFPICIHYFVKDNCSQCQNLAQFLENLVKKYQIDFKIYNVSKSEENYQLYQKLQKFYGISFAGFPIVFLGDSYLVGNQSIKENIEKVIIRCQKENCLCPVEELNQTLKQIPKPSTFTPEKKNEVSIVLFGKEFKFSTQSSLLFLGTVLGLADGINPCMFSVLLFLLTYLLAIGSKKRTIKAGLVFAISIFIIYFLFMLGMINLIYLIGAIKKIKIIISVFALIIGLILIKDFFAYGKWISLEIPQKTKPLIEKLIKKATIPSVILLALLSSLVELPCTAGIPLVYTTLLAEKNEYYVPYLLWYNFFFIVPILIIILGVAFAWAKLEKIEKWRVNFRKYMRLIAGFILLFLAFALFFDWI